MTDRAIAAFTGLLLLGACAEANHLGNPLMLPVAAVATGIDNHVYGARRGRVSAHLAGEGRNVLRGDAQAQLWRLAGTPVDNRSKVLGEIAALADGPDWVERATVIVMVHS